MPFEAGTVHLAVLKYEFFDSAGVSLGLIDIRLPSDMRSFNVPSIGDRVQLNDGSFDTTTAPNIVTYSGKVEKVNYTLTIDDSEHFSQNIYVVCKDSRSVIS